LTRTSIVSPKTLKLLIGGIPTPFNEMRFILQVMTRNIVTKETDEIDDETSPAG
jgi:hypothetical protein